MTAWGDMPSNDFGTNSQKYSHYWHCVVDKVVLWLLKTFRRPSTYGANFFFRGTPLYAQNFLKALIYLRVEGRKSAPLRASVLWAWHFFFRRRRNPPLYAQVCHEPDHRRISPELQPGWADATNGQPGQERGNNPNNNNNKMITIIYWQQNIKKVCM